MELSTILQPGHAGRACALCDALTCPEVGSFELRRIAVQEVAAATVRVDPECQHAATDADSWPATLNVAAQLQAAASRAGIVLLLMRPEMPDKAQPTFSIIKLRHSTLLGGACQREQQQGGRPSVGDRQRDSTLVCRFSIVDRAESAPKAGKWPAAVAFADC